MPTLDSRCDMVTAHFIVAGRAAIHAKLCDDVRWQAWFPGLRLAAYQDRGLAGVRWWITRRDQGTAEVWLQNHGDGAVAHVYLRLHGDPRRLQRRYLRRLQRGLFVAKDELEAGRRPGEPRQIGSGAGSSKGNRHGSDVWLSRPRPASASMQNRRR